MYHIYMILITSMFSIYTVNLFFTAEMFNYFFIISDEVIETIKV